MTLMLIQHKILTNFSKYEEFVECCFILVSYYQNAGKNPTDDYPNTPISFPDSSSGDSVFVDTIFCIYLYF